MNMFIYMCMDMYMCMYMYMCVCIYVYALAFVYLYVCFYLCVHVYVYMSVYVYVSVFWVGMRAAPAMYSTRIGRVRSTSKDSSGECDHRPPRNDDKSEERTREQ